MTHNVFGNVVDDNLLNQMPRYAGKVIKQQDRAREAMNLIDSGGKNLDAINYAKSRKSDYGNGVSALCVVYNATGESLRYSDAHDWYGDIDPNSPYPLVIGNGQWGGFLHVHPSGQTVGSTAAVVYRARDGDGHDHDCLISWDVPWGAAPNKAFCNVASVGTFGSEWAAEETLLSNSNRHRHITKDGCEIDVKMENGTSPFFTAKLTIPFTD